MKIENQDQLDAFYETWNDLAERAAKVGTTMLKLKGVKSVTLDTDDIRIKDSNLVLEYEEYLGCGDYENHYDTIPDSYLFDDQWIKDAKEKLRIKKEQEREKKRLRKEERERKTREREMEQLKKLQEKYGTNN